MDSQVDPSSFSPAQYGVAPAPLPASEIRAIELRALSTGEVLDRTFALYRRRFWLFSGIALVPALAITLSGVLRFAYTSYFPIHTGGTTSMQTSIAALAYAGRTSLLFLPGTLLLFVLLALAHAATARAVADLYQGLQPTVGQAYRSIRKGWLRWTGVYLWQLWSLGWLMLVCLAIMGGGFGLLSLGSPTTRIAGGVLAFLGGVGLMGASVYGVIAYLRNSLALPAAVLEEHAVRPAIRRSKILTSASKGRIFLLFLLLWALQLVLSGLQAPLAFAAVRAHGTGLTAVRAALLLIQLISATLIGPIGAIGLTLFYIDERVRREGFDIALAMTGSFLPIAPTMPPVTSPRMQAASAE